MGPIVMEETGEFKRERKKKLHQKLLISRTVIEISGEYGESSCATHTPFRD